MVVYIYIYIYIYIKTNILQQLKRIHLNHIIELYETTSNTINTITNQLNSYGNLQLFKNVDSFVHLFALNIHVFWHFTGAETDVPGTITPTTYIRRNLPTRGSHAHEYQLLVLLKCETPSVFGFSLVKRNMVKPEHAPVSDHSVFNLLASSDPIAIGCPTAADQSNSSSGERDPLLSAADAAPTTETSPSHMI